jgi:hypothetical protein
MRDLDVDELEQVSGASHCKPCKYEKQAAKDSKKAAKYSKKASKYAAKGDCKKASKYAAKAGIDICC